MTLSESFTKEDLQEFVKNGGKIIGVDVDTQIDFADEEGSLHVPANESVRQHLAALTQHIRYKIGSVDSHAFDAWEFAENGGPFPAHCVKGENGWSRIPETRTNKTRFIPMSEGNLEVGESTPGEGNRKYDAPMFADEVLNKAVTGIFEKEVYSAYANPNAKEFIRALVDTVGGVKNAVFAVYGYATGGYCVDAFAKGLAEEGFQTAIVEDATAPIDFAPEDGSKQDGAERTRQLALENKIKIFQTADILDALEEAPKEEPKN